MADNCVLTPEVNGEPSQLYKDLTKLIKDRALVNFIYASYLQQEVVDEMNRLGKKVNKQGQHSAKDVYEVLHVATLKNQILDLGKIELNIGARDINGDLINYTDANEAISKAKDLNDNNEGMTATVVQRGKVFNIIVEPRNSRTISRIPALNEMQTLWQYTVQAFNNVRVDLNALSQDSLLGVEVNATKALPLVSYLKNIQGVRSGLLSLRDIKLLLSLNPNSTRVQRLITKYGDVSNASQMIYDTLRNNTNATETDKRLMLFALDECKKYGGLDIDNLLQQLNQEAKTLNTASPEYAISQTLKEIDEKYHINTNVIHIMSNEIRSLSEASANALITLQRQLREEESQRGITTEAEELEKSIRSIQKDLDSKQYYYSCLKFLDSATKQLEEIDSLLNNLKTITGTDREVFRKKAQTITKAKALKDAYYPIVKALSDMQKLVTDENISLEEQKVVEESAIKLKDLFDRQDAVIKDLSVFTFKDICIEILGDSLPNGTAIADIVAMADGDSYIFDYLRGVADTSNPLINSMGSIIRDAQDERNKKLTDIENRISIANRKLFDSGSNSKFMYGDDGYIISDLDWVSYKKAKDNERKRLKNQGLKGLELKKALDEWEILHTEERVVDNVSGRTERVPGGMFKKEFPTLTSAQLEYYKEMMQIKGEIGTLLPAYAQKHYLPPQLRRSFLDAISDSKNANDVFKAIWNLISNIWTKREDDTDYASMGVIDGEDYGLTYGNLNNTPLRQIPIFYVKRIKDQDELLKDFSGALQHLAGTAINYDAMANVKDVIEFMGDFIKNQQVHSTINGIKEAEVMTSQATAVVKDLYDIAKRTGTAAIIDGFIDQHIYGVKLKDTGKFSKLFKTLLKYTSIKNLTTNIPGAIANLSIAEVQLVQEAIAGEFFNFKDYSYAHTRLFGDATTRGVGKLVDFFNNDKNSIDVLLADFFDPIPGRFNEQMHKRYYKSFGRKIVENINPMTLYATGEYIVHYVGMYSILHNKKVLLNGKEIPLIQAFDKTPKSNISELKLKDGVTDLNGNLLSLDSNYFDEIRRTIRYVNESTQGAMSEESKGIIHQRMFGKSIMQFRQWMIKQYDKRFRGEYWDATLKESREGYTTTVGKVIKGWCNDIFNTHFQNTISWHDARADKHKRANLNRYIAERAIFSSLLLLSFALGDLEENEDDFWFRVWLYNHKRMKQDVSSMMPLGALLQAKSIASNPIPALSTINGFLYIFYGLEDLDETIDRGKYKGWNKYARNLLRYTVPFYKQIDQFMSIAEDDTMFSVFDTANRYR